VLLFLILYAIMTLFIFLTTINYYPEESVANYVYENISENGNVAFLSENKPFHSSTVMWYLSQLDKNKTIRVYRSCMFDNKSSEQILELLKNNNIHYIVYSKWGNNNQLEKIKDNLTLAHEITNNGLTTEIYVFDDFQYDPNKKACNYICLTEQTICI